MAHVDVIQDEDDVVDITAISADPLKADSIAEENCHTPSPATTEYNQISVPRHRDDGSFRRYLLVYHTRSDSYILRVGMNGAEEAVEEDRKRRNVPAAESNSMHPATTQEIRRTHTPMLRSRHPPGRLFLSSL